MSEQASAPSPSAGSESSAPESQVSGSTSNSTSESGNAPAPTGAQASQIVNALESAEKQADGTYELVIDGETVTLTLEEMKAGYQKARASAKRFQEAAQLKKEAEEFKAETAAKREAMRKNPLKYLMEDGVDEKAARSHYEEAVWKWLQEDQMTPEQKAERDHKKQFESEKKRIEAEKAEIEKWKAERQAEKEAKEIEKYQNEYAAQLTDALAKHSLPQNPRVVAQLIEYMKDGLSYDDTFSFDDAAQAYKEEHQGTIDSYLKSLTPEQLMARLGPEGVKAFRKQDVALNTKNPTPTKAKPSAPQPKGKDSKISSKDFFANLGKK